MFEITKKKLMFTTKEIWFCEKPYDVEGCAAITFKNCIFSVSLLGFEKEDFTTLTIDLTKDLDSIWLGMKKSSCQYGIKKAVKYGVVVRQNDRYEEFCKMNEVFRIKKKALITRVSPAYMRQTGTLFVAEKEGELLAGHFYLHDDTTIRQHVGASKRLAVTKEEATLIGNANRLLVWEAIKYSKAKGLKTFDLGGYYTGKVKDEQKERINYFKEAFGGDLKTYYNYTKYYSTIYKEAKNLRNLIMR